jgi:hypothetical protein
MGSGIQLMRTADIGRMWSANLWHQEHIRGTVSEWEAKHRHLISAALSDLGSPLIVAPGRAVLLNGHFRYASAIHYGALLLPVIDDPLHPSYPDAWRWLGMERPAGMRSAAPGGPRIC